MLLCEQKRNREASRLKQGRTRAPFTRAEKNQLSAGARGGILKAGRAIANLNGSDVVEIGYLAEAVERRYMNKEIKF